MADEEEKEDLNQYVVPDPDAWAKPVPVIWEEQSFNPDRPLTPRAKKLCQLVAGGMTKTKAAEKVGYSKTWASKICNCVKGKKEILRFQEKVFEMGVADRVKDLGNPALDVVEDILTTEDPGVKPQLKLQAAMWVAEKVSGKAKQEVEHTGNILHEFVDKLKHLEDSGQVLDVTPTKALAAPGEEGAEVTERDKLDVFLDFEATDIE